MAKRVLSHIGEDDSKRAFEEKLKPFFVNWNQRDYGIDGTVEIATQTDSTGDANVLGKCFLLQIKSVNKIKKGDALISYPLPVEKITHWYGYNLPVLFALYDLENKDLYYLWINDILIGGLESANENWSQQKSITVKIPLKNLITSGSLDEIKRYVITWKRPMPMRLTAGKYFSLKDKALSLLGEYKEYIASFKFTSTEETIKQLESAVHQSLYRVSITGLSRAGKSSLINALLNKRISPVGFFQTTGVPIQIIPGLEDKVSVYFEDLPDVHEPFDENLIKQFASQECNPNNEKKVKLVSISVKNKNLERGVSLFDIPGLDDPDDDILEYTLNTVRRSNAIIYVIDLSPAEHGGFIFREYIREI